MSEEEHMLTIGRTVSEATQSKQKVAILKGCGSFAIEAKAQSFNQIDGVLSVPTARIRGDIDTPAGYLLHPR
jgi:hypothetical protein